MHTLLVTNVKCCGLSSYILYAPLVEAATGILMSAVSSNYCLHFVPHTFCRRLIANAEKGLVSEVGMTFQVEEATPKDYYRKKGKSEKKNVAAISIELQERVVTKRKQTRSQMAKFVLNPL